MLELPESLKPTARGPGRLIIVDRKPERRARLADFFREEGYEVLSFANPKDLLPSIASGPPDVVILDVEAEGIQVCRQLRVTPTTRLTPILLIAEQRPDEGEIVRALTCGADDYVEASLSFAELGARVRVQMRNRQERDLLLQALRRGDQYKDEAHTDALTQLPNRRAADKELERLLGSSATVALIMFDIDHFKSINDRFGHPVGDQVLQALAATLERTARDGDFFARIGGEEFLVAARVPTEQDARALGDRFRRAVQEMQLSRDVPVDQVTVSAGVSFWEGEPHEACPPADLLELADQALYRAKAAGRNRVELARAPQA